MSSVKCPQCGLANFAADFECRRCQSSLRRQELFQAEVVAGPGRRSLVRWAIWIVGVTWLIVFIWSRSLIFTSEPLEMRKRWQVNDAIGVLERAGFSREVFILRHLTNYRATDSWWNAYQGHENAYASTNFPLEIVTLYPKFFEDAVDDTERAAILLHEGQHLLGLNEAEALERTWREKARIGWTRDRYGESKVFAATEETTFAGTSLFQCKENHHSDCIPPVVPVLSPRKTSSSIR
jgi:hypothetical protein